MYNNMNYSSLDEVYGSAFLVKEKKNTKKRNIVKDPVTPEYEVYEQFQSRRPPQQTQYANVNEGFETNQISKDLYERSKDFANPWDQEMAMNAGGGTFNPYEEAQAMINPKTPQQQQYNNRIFAEPNIYNYSSINKLPDGQDKKPLQVGFEANTKENFELHSQLKEKFQNDVQMANVLIHVAFGLFVLYGLDKLLQLGKLLSK